MKLTELGFIYHFIRRIFLELSYHPEEEYFAISCLVNDLVEKNYQHYNTKITIKNDIDSSRKISYESPVVRMSDYSFLRDFHLNHFCIPLSLMKTLMNCKIIDCSHGLYVDLVNLCIDVKVYKRI